MWLTERMRNFGDQEALICGNRSYSYFDVLNILDEWRGLLRNNSVNPGAVVAIVGDFCASSCAAFLALIENGNIIVPLTSNSLARHPEFVDIAEVEFILQVDTASRIKARYVQTANELILNLKNRKEAGLVFFSSGSTGESKASIHAMTPFLEKFRPVRSALRTLVFLLFDHIGGINTFLHIISNGGVMVVPQERTPKAVCQVIESSRVELLPVSPTFLNLLLLSEAYHGHDMSSLKKITYGTEPMPQSTLRRICQEFLNVELQQTYGLSEVGILHSKSKRNNSLWVKVGGREFQTKVIDGVLWIKSNTAMLGYLNAASPFDDEDWFNTGDTVEVEGEYIRFLGRQSEIINVGGEKVYPAEVENHILELENIRDVVVFAESNSLTGQMVVASLNLINHEPVHSLKQRIRKALKNKLERYKLPQKVIVVGHDQFNERYKRMRLRRPDGDQA